MTTSLFRRQVVDARKDNWLGEAQIVQPLSIAIVTWTCLSLVAAGLLFVIFGTYTRRVHAEGVLFPNIGLITVASSKAGRIGSAGAREGDHVTRGQLLYTIDVDAVSASGPTQERVITELGAQKTSLARQRAARASLAITEKRALREQLDNTISQNGQIGEQVELQGKLSASVKDRADELARAVDKGLARSSDFQNQNYLYIQANAQLAQLKQSGLQLDGKIADLKAQIGEFDDKLARELAEMDRSVAQLDQQIAESEAQRAIEVRAPENGVLTSIRVHAGQQVAAGATLLTLLPSEGRLQANLYVDSSAIGFVETDEPVMLRYAAFPFQRFGLYRGLVTEVTRAPLDSGDQPASASASKPSGAATDGLYRIIVRPDRDAVMAYGSEKRLEAGMRVEADIALEKRPLYRWLLDPINHIKNSAVLVTQGAPR